MKNILAWTLSAIAGVILQFVIFMTAYQKLTFPFLQEEQRTDNAPYIFFYVLPAILLATLISIFVFYLFSRNKDRNI